MEQTIDETNATPKRPTFLTVLCILTFIGSGMGIFNGISSAFMSKTVGTVMDATKSMDSLQHTLVNDSLKSPEEKATAELANKMVGNILGGLNETNIRNNGYATIVSSLLTLLGALMMWGLRKMGFWMYVIGIVVSIVAPIAIYGSGNLMGAFSAIGMGFIGLVFVILYAVNRKHLVN